MRALYISYDGALDPLGATQVLPYILGLAGRGVAMTLISFEKEARWADVESRERVRRALEAAGVTWRPQAYHKRPRVPATLFDVFVGMRAVRKAARETPPAVVHCRGDVAMTMARVARLGPTVRVLYDMRGFFSDERVDAGSWRAGSLLDRVVKREERANRRRADAVVVLTERARRTLEQSGAPSLVRVIPTCVDTARFRPRRATEAPEFGLAYVGSLGTWYMAREMVAFSRLASAVFQERPLFLTPDLDEAARVGIDASWSEVRSVPAEEVPKWLAKARALVCFVRPTSSKSASFPTKVGEAWACGLPVVVNPGVGDVDAMVARHSTGVVVPAFDHGAYEESGSRLALLLRDPDLGDRCRALAEHSLDLGEGVRRYHEIYLRLGGTGGPVNPVF